MLTAWQTVEYVPGQRMVAERNPYYWKVDPDGKQLPYIDKIVIIAGRRPTRYPAQDHRRRSGLHGARHSAG